MKRTASGMKKPRILSRTTTRVYNPSGALRQRRISGPVYMKLRYRVTEENQIAISPADLLSACGCIAYSGTQAYRIFEAIRVQYAKLVGTPPTSGNINTVRMEFVGGENRGNNNEMINSSNNSLVAPQLYGKPSRYSTASDWANSAVTASFIAAIAPVNSILEVGVWVNKYESNNDCSIQTGTGFTPGKFYYISPDANLEPIA